MNVRARFRAGCRWLLAVPLALVTAGVGAEDCASAGQPLLIVPVELSDQSVAARPAIGELQRRRGALPASHRNQFADAADLPVAELLDAQGRVLHTQPFQFKRQLTVPPAEGGHVHTAPVDLTRPSAVLVMPAMPEAHDVRVRLPRNQLAASSAAGQAMRALPAIPLSEAQCSQTPPRPAPAAAGSFNVLLLASGFDASNLSQFQSKADEVKSLMLATEPYKSLASRIKITPVSNTQSMGCANNCAGIERLMCCDDTKVIAAATASGQPFDEIVVLHNLTSYAGSGGRDLGTFQTNSYNSYTTAYIGTSTGPMVLHEFGHSFGNLCDEYTYGSEGYAYNECANCKATCSDFENLALRCSTSCDARPNFSRPEDSVMLTLGILTYNGPSIERSLKPRLQYFIGSTTATLSSLSVSGDASVASGATLQLTARASYSDGSVSTVNANWSVSGPATISSSGLLTAGSVTADTVATVTATFTQDGVSRTTTFTVTIKASGTAATFPVLTDGAGVSGAITAQTLTAAINVPSTDMGKAGQLYVAAIVGGQLFLLDPSRGWVAFAAGQPLPVFASVTLGQHSLPIVGSPSNLTPYKGLDIYVGYGVGGSPTEADNSLFAAKTFAKVYTVQ